MSSHRKGATGIAYGLMVGLVAVVALGAITGSGSSIKSLFGETSDTLENVANGTGGASGSQASPTPAGDIEPDSFSFVAASKPASTLSLSDTVTVSGFDGPLTATISGTGSPEFQVNSGSFGTTAAVSPGDQITLRLTSGPSAGNTRTASFSLGSASVDWTVTTVSIPDASALSNALDGPVSLYGFWWYLSTVQTSCDTVCTEAGGSNLANSATTIYADNCSSADTDDVSYHFYNNGNAAGWSSYGGGTGYHTLGYGYTGGSFYGKCAGGNNTDAGTFPGETNGHSTRANVCPCFTD